MRLRSPSLRGTSSSYSRLYSCHLLKITHNGLSQLIHKRLSVLTATVVMVTMVPLCALDPRGLDGSKVCVG